MDKLKFNQANQSVAVSKLVTLERIRRRRNALPKALIEQGLETDIEKRIARALGGELRPADLTASEVRYMQQVQALVEAG